MSFIITNSLDSPKYTRASFFRGSASMHLCVNDTSYAGMQQFDFVAYAECSACCWNVCYLSDDFRMFCGDLGNEVTDETLVRAFSRYPSFIKARVVRDKKTNKTKGYGFASFRDPNDFVKAMREMNGKTVIDVVMVSCT